MIPNKIQGFFHCRKCLEEIDNGISGTTSPRDYVKLEVGWTEKGFQVWCIRHEINIGSFDFLGQKIQVDDGSECLANIR